jgi:hypothetical protein
MSRSQNRYQTESPMTLQKLVEETHEYHAQTGGYRPSDIHRILGDQRKGIGLSVPSVGAKHVAVDAANNKSDKKKHG